ncbi:MAG: DUF1549 domain-containing protein [Akkermansiaceae bacterium]|nr:DUF1549 domain-containing protein [Akkermansiaceae bacterium]
MKSALPAGILAAMTGPLAGLPASAPTAEQIAYFEKRVRPVLVEHCYECHSAEGKTKGGLRLDTREATLRGGDSGPAIVPGKPGESLLVAAIRHTDEDLKMPEKKKLSDRAIADLAKWVAMGAPDPRQETAGADSFVVQEIDLEKGREFWAFQPPVEAPAPKVKAHAWPRSVTDRFLLAAMEAKGLQPVADADRRTLARRMYFDLTGLPPTPAQLRAFLDDDAPDAAGRLVDQLLASPHFGERWGRHWLDVARYSESNGMERNFTYPHAWRYRDYVIEAFNKDKPYDQFIREQIAGDLLDDGDAPGSTAEERLVATGFLALGPKQLNERDKQVFTMDLVDEQIDASTRAVLGLTVSCARCHDHKFDPIGMEDYYALAGIFTSSRTLYGTQGGGGNRQASGLMALGEDGPGLEKARQEHQKKVAAEQKRLAQANKRLANLRKQAARSKARQKEAMEERMDEMREQTAELKGRLGELRKNAPPLPAYAMGATEGGSPGDCRICLRGDPKKRGPQVARGYLRVVEVASAPPPAGDASGRKELAQWLTSPENPLTARVMVNRIWHHLFGTGLVRTVDNFGLMGERPVNRDLLDHLAVQFMDDGWSVKETVRRLMRTRAYQLSGRHDARNFEIDPENRHCWQMSHRRLGAEAIRDAILLAGGKLELAPYEGSVVQELGNVNFGRQQANLDGKSASVANHRSIYLPIIRNAVPEALRVFDFAEPSLIVGNRPVTNVPTQALYMLNDPFVLEHTGHLAARVLEEGGDASRRVDRAYLLTLSRRPEPSERERALALVDAIRTGLDTGDQAERERTAWAALAQSLIGSAEFRYLH